MHTITRISIGALLTLTVAACGDDDGRADGGDTAGSSGEDPTAATMSATMTSVSATVDPSETDPTQTDPSETDPSETDPSETADTTAGESEFEFEDGDPASYQQIDRMGMPAIATAVITSKDAYNAATPTDDAAGDFVPEIVANISGLHDALDDDLMGVGLTPCDVDTCVAQGAPLVVPDVLRVDFTTPSGFPNGRRPIDPVIDITLAVVLLDLSVHGVTTLADLPLNPPEGDLEPLDDFPFFAEPH